MATSFMLHANGSYVGDMTENAYPGASFAIAKAVDGHLRKSLAAMRVLD